MTRRNAQFQHWQALLTSRARRHRTREFLVQGVRPITMAVAHGWDIGALLVNADAQLSDWARHLLDTADGARYGVSAELIGELGGKPDSAPEILAVVRSPGNDLGRVRREPGMITIVFDRPSSPGNLGTLIRSADAFGASGVIVTGHAADVYDPQTVRASTGSLFCLPVVMAASHQHVLDWTAAVRADGVMLHIVGTDEAGDLDISAVDLTEPTLLVIGNETTGLSVSWRRVCDQLARIPMVGAASSLNAATSASIVLYERARQRIAASAALR